MTDSPDDRGGDPRRLLTEHKALAGRVRAAQRATWFPLLVFAAVTFVAVPVYRFGSPSTTCRTVGGGDGPVTRICAFYSSAGLYYWPIALLLAYVVIAAFALRRARERGLGTRVLPYAAVGAVLAVLLGAAAGWAAGNPPTPGQALLGVHLADVFGLAAPGLAIGVALLVLAFVERNRPLLAVTVIYLVLLVVPPGDLGWTVRFPSPWYFLPRLVIDGTVLLLAGLAFARAQAARPKGTR